MLKKIKKGSLAMLLVLVISSVWVLRSEAEPPALSRLSGAEKVRVAKLIEGAKKEGKLAGYSHSFRPDVQEAIMPKFKEWYGLSSDFQISFISLRTDAVITKVTEELRAQVYKADIAHNAAIDWFNDLVARGELMAYDSPEYRHFCPLSINPAIAPTNPPYFIAGQFSIQQMIAYNPKHVKGEILRWKDLLRPEYKGKISCGDVSISSSLADSYIAIRKVLDANFFKELAKQDPFLLGSTSDLVNKSVTGEFPITVTSASPVFRSNLTGGGLKMVFPTEGIPAVGAQMAILNHAPHPNAAKLFIDFYHSEVAQKILLEGEGYPVGRLGMKSKYTEYPVPIYDMKGVISMDWRKVTSKDRSNARDEFRRLVIEKK